MGGDCAHTYVLYGVNLTHLDQNNLPLDEETERYVDEAVNWKSRFYTHMGRVQLKQELLSS